MEKKANITLEDIVLQKKELRLLIDVQREMLTECTREIFNPQAPTSRIEAMTQSFNKGIAVYDGIMMGVKIMKRVRNFFAKSKSTSKQQ